MTANVLTADRVEYIFRDSMFKDGEDTTDHIIAEGITINIGFNPDRIQRHRQAIHDMLAELPDEFKTSAGGGHSFLNACMDKHGNQWTGMHRTQEQLVLLGVAIDEVAYCLPRSLWTAFPGAVPYFVVKQ